MAGNFVISLDFELLWGMRDVATRASYGANVLGARKAIPAMLDLFHRCSIRATLAIVGLLLCESKIAAGHAVGQCGGKRSEFHIKQVAASRALLNDLAAFRQ